MADDQESFENNENQMGIEEIEMPKDDELKPSAPKKEKSDKKSSAALILGVIALVLLVIGGGFYMYWTKSQERQATIDADEEARRKVLEAVQPVIPIPKEEPPAPAIDKPDKVVQDFYDWFLTYEGDPLKVYDENEAVSDELKAFIDQNKSESQNPFFCSSDKPTDFDVLRAESSGNTASVPVDLTINGLTTSLKVDLKLEDDMWKMTKIRCLPKDELKNLMETIMQDVGLENLVVKDTVFIWNIADHKTTKEASVNGKGFSAKNSSVDSLVIKNYLTKNGFRTDRHNLNGRIGYRKNNTVCVLVTKGLDIDLSCGKHVIY